MFWIRPSSQGGLTLGLLEENLELSQVNCITDDSSLAIFLSLPERFCRRFFITDHYPVPFRSNVVDMLPFSLQPQLSAADGSDIGQQQLGLPEEEQITCPDAGKDIWVHHQLILTHFVMAP